MVTDKDNLMDQKINYKYTSSFDSDFKELATSYFSRNDSSKKLINKYEFKSFVESENETFYNLALMDLLGRENYINYWEQYKDQEAISKAALESCNNDQEKIGLISSAFDMLNNEKINVNQTIPFIKSFNSDELSILSKLSFIKVFKPDDSSTNRRINLLALRILSQSNGRDLIDICSGKGDFLEAAYQNNHDLNLFGQEINPFDHFVSRFRLYISGSLNHSIRLGNALTEPQFLEDNSLKKFDMVFTNFPFLQKINFDRVLENKKFWTNYQISFSPKNTADWIFIGLALNMLKPEGIAAAIISSGALLKITDKDIRQKLVEDDRIEAIIQLPDYTRIPTAMIVLSHGNKSIKMIDASEWSEPCRSENDADNEGIEKIYEWYKTGQESANCRIVSKSEIKANNYNLSLSRYFDSNSIRIKSPGILSSVTQRIFRGIQTMNKELDQLTVPNSNIVNPYKILSISNIEDGQITSELPLAYIESNKRFDRYCLEDGDIVLSAKGTNIKIAVACISQEEKVLATGNLIVIRVKKNKVNPYYLKAFFDCSTGKKLLQSIQTGSVIASINPSQLENLQISLPEKNIQEKIAALYLTKQDMIALTKKKLAELEQELENVYDLVTGEV